MRLLLIGLAIGLLAISVHAQSFETRYDKLPSGSLVEQLDGQFAAAPGAQPRPLLKIGLTLIKESEGWSPRPYNDAVGYCTIGYGHLIAKQKCQALSLGEFANGISFQKGEEILLKDTISARVSIQRLVSVAIDDEQFAALTSFVFNVGSGNFSQSSLLRLLNDNNIKVAVGQFGRWIKAGGKELPGLVIRRGCEQSLFVGDLALSQNGQIDRSTCVRYGAAPSAGPAIDIFTGR